MFTKQDIKRLLIPLIIEQVLAVLVGMADVMMVAAVGEAAVSGVSLVDSISLLIINLFAALTTGGAVLVAQYLGKKRPGEACQAAGQLLSVTICLSLIIAGSALAANRHLLVILFGKVDSGVMDNAVIYFSITTLSYPFLAVYNACAALYRSMGNSKVSMKASIFMNLLNVTGNAVCIFGLGMGVEGAALPTLISRIAAALLMMHLVRKPENPVHIDSLQQLKPDWGIIRKILSVGIPNGLENSMFQLGKIILQSLIAGLSTAAIASYAVAGNLVTLQYLPGNAISLGLITIVGQCIGAGRYDEAKRYVRQLIRLNYVLAAFICAGMAAIAQPLVGIYQLSQEASDLAVLMIRTHCLAMCIWPLSFTLPAALRAGMDAKFTMMVSIFSMWTFRIGLSYLAVYSTGMGVMGIWVAMFTDWVFRSVLFLFRFRGFEKRRMGI